VTRRRDAAVRIRAPTFRFGRARRRVWDSPRQDDPRRIAPEAANAPGAAAFAGLTVADAIKSTWHFAAHQRPWLKSPEPCLSGALPTTRSPSRAPCNGAARRSRPEIVSVPIAKWALASWKGTARADDR